MRKSHCKRGHPLSGPNLYIRRATNDRYIRHCCRACQHLTNQRNQQSDYWQRYRIEHAADLRLYNNIWTNRMRQRRRLLAVIDTPAPYIEPVGLNAAAAHGREKADLA